MDTLEAGSGYIKVVVRSNNQSQPSTVVKLSEHVHRVTFTPKQSSPHLVQVTFCGLPVPGSPFRVQVSSDVNVFVTGRSVESTPINKQALFVIDASKAKMRAEPKVKILSE